MKLIRPSYEIIEQGPGLQGIYDMIEKCGKTSYKSEPKGGDVAKMFVEARAKEKHGAVLEFGTVYLKIEIGSPMYDNNYLLGMGTLGFYKHNPYSKVIERDEIVEADGHKFPLRCYYITTNYRVLVENGRLSDYDEYGCDATEYHEKRYAVKFITDIGVGREFLRHRTMSMVQESTRYVNYMKDKFGEELTFVIPSWVPEEKLATGENICWWDDDWVDMDKIKIVKHAPAELELDPVEVWLNAMYNSECTYRTLINAGWVAQQARGVLPLSAKTEFVMSGFRDSWLHFFCLRSDIAATGKPHPQAQELANPLRDEFIGRGYITNEELNERAKQLKDAEEKRG